VARPRYDIDAQWDDPFEPRSEKRGATRVPGDLGIKIGVMLANHGVPLVGPGKLKDMSSTGLLCHTKHRLSPGQMAMLRIPTKTLASDLGLPKYLFGNARVVRTEAIAGDLSATAFHFADDFASDITLDIFVTHLPAVSGVES